MGRIQTDQANLPGPPPPQAQVGPPPSPPPPNAAYMMPQYNVPQHQARYNNIAPHDNNAGAAQFGHAPVQSQYGAGSGVNPIPGQVGSPYLAGAGSAQHGGVYNNNGGAMQYRQQNSPYPGSTGLQMPKLWPRGNGGYVGTNPWNTGLFDCMQDPSNAFATALFPCVTFGQIADVLDNGHTNCVTSGIIYAFSPCMLSRAYRTKLRRMFGLVEAPAADWMVHTLFEPCALCQEYRELNSRGIDPALGYLGNKERLQNQRTASNPQVMAPPQNQTMS